MRLSGGGAGALVRPRASRPARRSGSARCPKRTWARAIMNGTKVDFEVSAFPDQTFQGVIARPSHSLDMKTRSMLVELDVMNAQAGAGE
jgi:hypothetical protein